MDSGGWVKCYKARPDTSAPQPPHDPSRRKGFDVDRMYRGYLATVQHKLNARPKKVLHGSMPAEVAFLLSGVALRG
jgi:hypothetical protein